jgi:arsenite methyltransferase
VCRLFKGDENVRAEGRSKRRWKAQYAEVAAQDAAGGGEASDDPFAYAKSIGYSEQEVRSVPAEAAITHGCGNPTALAQLRLGQVVLDLGCGGGLDAFLAAQRVGPEGRVIGLDMTPEMVEKATAAARKGGYANVEFRVAEIEKLPVADDSVDVVISNCVINHALDKPAVFKEVHRVLKAGGSMFLSDLVTTGRFPKDMLRKVNEMWAPWLAVASDRREYLQAVQQGGFRTMTVRAEGLFPMAEADAILRGRVLSIQVKADK